MVVGGLLVALQPVSGGESAGTVFTYQGQLKQNGVPVSRLRSFVFRLFDDPTFGSQVGPDNIRSSVAMVNGFFTVDLDFGPGAFDGDARWLWVVVEGAPLSRQPIHATPYAIRALSAPDGHALDAADGVPANALFVDDAGEVGIGTIDPRSKLEVAFSGSNGVIVRGDGTGFASYDIINGAFTHSIGDNLDLDHALTLTSGLHKDLVLRTTTENFPRERMRITNDGRVGIGDSTPFSLLTVGEGKKFQVDVNGSIITAGDLRFTDDRDTIGFPASAAPNSPMVYMFQTGVENADRMVLAHSPSFPNWGLQYQDLAGNEFHFLRDGMSVMTVDLENATVGINTASPSGTFKLDVAGQVRCTSLMETSSRRFKQDIKTVEGALDKMCRLRGVSFVWDEEHGGGEDIGLIAEDVAQVVPQAVHLDSDGDGPDAAGSKYGHLSALTVEAVKELNAKLEHKEAEITALRERLDRLEARLQLCPVAQADHASAP